MLRPDLEQRHFLFLFIRASAALASFAAAVEAHRDDADAVVGAGVSASDGGNHGLQVAGQQERLFEAGLDVRIEPARFGMRRQRFLVQTA
jgi:hypothetical protein